MKNTENAAMPISAMSQRLFFPRRLSGRPEQVSRSADIRSSTVPTLGLNLTRHQLDTVHIHPDSISRTLRKAALPAKMRIAGLTRWNFGLGALTLLGVFAIALALILPDSIT